MKNSNGRNVIELNLNPEDKNPRAEADKELNKAFGLISDRASRGQQDEEDIAFAKSRREYLSDTQLTLITGMTYDEIEEEIANAGSEVDLSKLKLPELVAKATELGLVLTGDEKKADLIAKIEEATA